jgi:hypothetical protein
METANYWNFSKSKGHNSGKNGSIVPKTELDLDILTINLYTKFHFNICNQCKENERKLLVDRPTDSSKAICPPSSEWGMNIKASYLTIARKASVQDTYNIEKENTKSDKTENIKASFITTARKASVQDTYNTQQENTKSDKTENIKASFITTARKASVQDTYNKEQENTKSDKT